MITWKRHLGEYRSDRGYMIRSPQRGSYWTLLTPDGAIHGRYPKLEGAKLAAEWLELRGRRQELKVGRNGHEVFDSPWGCYDLTVARQIAQQRGQPDQLQVKDWAEAAKPHQVCVSQPESTGPILVATTLHHGLIKSLVIDGYVKILRAHEQKVEWLDCLVLTQDDTELIKVA
jgi:hypothetical protein